MRSGSAIVDVAIDQGGCFETSRPTTHADPTFIVDGVVHYCVANMPGAVPRTSTYALNNATLPYVARLAGLGLAAALDADPGLRAGLNVFRGEITQPAVASAFGLPYRHRVGGRGGLEADGVEHHLSIGVLLGDVRQHRPGLAVVGA